MTWLAPAANYLPNELTPTHVPYPDANNVSGLPSMASFRSQTNIPYVTSANEQTAQTGETLGKALQAVKTNLYHRE